MKLMRILPLAGVCAGSLALTGCGGGISGTYGGDDCLYTLEFNGKENVYITTFGTEAGTYRVDGDRVIVTASDGQSIIFTKKGGKLETSFFGETMVCEKQ
jgi:hypothetical protein